MKHENEDIQNALIKLTDALCSWERVTGIDSVLILRDTTGFNYRAINGKTEEANSWMSDLELLSFLYPNNEGGSHETK
ncbi:hypothetical protein HY745_13395 [Candidatus Desantisbacteria bacterium]|nr:hypothetical protein [Candidatus Desantisbacteria bacterium]